QEEFDGIEIAEEIFDVPVVENSLQSEARTGLQFERVLADDVIPIIGRVGTGIARVEERENHSLGLQDCVNAVHHRFYERLVQIIGSVPAENGVELFLVVNKVLAEEPVCVENRLAVFSSRQHERRIRRRFQNIFVVNLVPKPGQVRNVGG